MKISKCPCRTPDLSLGEGRRVEKRGGAPMQKFLRTWALHNLNTAHLIYYLYL